jgi:predicted GH43/DUF377 family glycosyl hydrolase
MKKTMIIEDTVPHLRIKRKRVKLNGDYSRVVTRFYAPEDTIRIPKIINRVLELPDAEAESLLDRLMLDFSERHKDIRRIFERNMEKVRKYIPDAGYISETKKLLIGAYFTMEYSVEAAALFNPSIVLHPNQSDLPDGGVRFIMSLRATGEGHISSIVFRSGIIDKINTFHFDPISNYVETPNVRLNMNYNRYLFRLKLSEMGAGNEVTAHIMDQLPDDFTYAELMDRIAVLKAFPLFSDISQSETIESMNWLANSNYETTCEGDGLICERVIFPVSKNESRGIEDARFVKFVDDNGEVTYYATYTAYNGFSILPQLIETKDFITFKIITLNGKAVQNKGMALFPRKINGKYVMLSRQDGENNSIMFSDNIHFWQESKIIAEPKQPWEFMQVGNCGSPIETGKGWLVLTHGVGPMRQYCIGAILLDLENPSKILARLDEPLLSPREEEREGYVPNVVYTCGSMIHNGELIIPYAMSDSRSGIATIGLDELLSSMRKM